MSTPAPSLLCTVSTAAFRAIGLTIAGGLVIIAAPLLAAGVLLACWAESVWMFFFDLTSLKKELAKANGEPTEDNL